MAISGKKNAPGVRGGDRLLAAANLAAGILSAQRMKPDYKKVCRETAALLARLESELEEMGRRRARLSKDKP